ncbi:MAG: helix-turn-helix transcriptional regulator [bacterium]|nr:helix-turn-helix transcriptional regulator [bacterium]
MAGSNTKDRNKLIGERIKKIREHLGLKQKEFAESMSIQSSYLSEIESGKKNASTETLNKLFDIHNINISYLFTGEGNYFIQKEENGASHQKKTLSQLNAATDLMDELYWYLENIPVVRFAVIEFFKGYLYEKRGMVEEEVTKLQKKETDSR